MTGPTGKIGTNISEELFTFAGLEIRFLLTSSDCNGTMSVFEFSVPPNFKIPGPAHSNDGYEEMVYGLEGILTWTVNDTDVQVGAGQALCIPRGAVHRWANNGSVPAKQLTVISPGVMGPEYFREVKQLLSAGAPPNPAAMVETMRHLGMIPVVPPRTT
ncbi:MAG TPA: cupin domain-containing protein [Terriglobia bacterium]|nr:cupin domain-containing protein [Terriglobia bacterium]